jgi:hypothetical protein
VAEKEAVTDERRQPFVVHVAPGATTRDLDAYLSRIDDDRARTAASYVLRMDPSQLDGLQSSEGAVARATLASRITSRPVFGLTFAPGARQHLLYRISLDGVTLAPAELQKEHIPEVRQADLATLIEDAGEACLVHATPLHHFAAPSGRHCSTFLRLADAIRSREALDRLAFWLLPTVVPAAAVVIDNWSVASIVIRCLQMQGLTIPFDCLGSYPSDNPRSAAAVLSGLLAGIEPDETVACVVSVSSSGRLVRTVRDLLQSLGRSPDRLHATAVYGLSGGSATYDVLCAIPIDPKNASPDECPECATGSKALRLDPSLYYVKHVPETPVLLNERHYAEPAAFFARYSCVPACFAAHRNNDHDNRHHAFHLDLVPLLEHAVFLDRYINCLRQLRADVVISPSHTVGQLMGRIAADTLNARHIVQDSLYPAADLPTDIVGPIKEARSVVIVDDVMISGSRMERYNTGLRESFGGFDEVAFVVGVDRTPSPLEWQRNVTALTRKVRWQASLTCIDSLHLPNWGPPECPWCAEFESLASLSSELAEPAPWLQARVATLTERERGVRAEWPLLIPGVTAQRLGRGAHAGPEGMEGICTLFSTASAIQLMRHDSPGERLDPRFPAVRVFAAVNLKNYSEALLRACLVRSVTRHEWGIDNLVEAEQRLVTHVEVAGGDVVLGEIIAALLRRSIGRGVARLLNDTLSRALPLEWPHLRRGISGS